MNWARPQYAEPYRGDDVHLSQDAAAYLAERAVTLVGVDYLQAGGAGPDGAATHRTLLQGGIPMLGGLDLTRVERGPYELVCLLLRLAWQ